MDARPVGLPCRLTAREIDVLTLLTAGLSNTEIGARLSASPRTVSTHVEHILAKLGQSSRTGAAALAVERGYLRLPLPGRGPVPAGLAVCQLHRLAAGERSAQGHGTGPGDVVGPGWPEPGRPGRRRPGEHALRIGSAFPLTGPAADDGRQMRNGSALAVAEINARGGIGGRLVEQVVVDADIFSADGIGRAFGQLFDADVDAVTSGYVFAEGAAARLAARYGAPYVHATTSQTLAETVRENRAAYANVFQVCPTEVHYGPGFIRFLDAETARGWRPPSRSIAFVDTDLPSGQLAGQPTLDAAGRSGWRVAALHRVPAIGADWEFLISELERIEPAAVMIAQFLAGELAAFQRLAAGRLPRTLIYAIYAPSVPEFLQAAGASAEGVVWATVTGTYGDSIGRRFRADYASSYGRAPGWSHAGIAYDEVHLLARSWMAAGRPRDFGAVCGELRRLRYRGVNGSYVLDNAEQSGLCFPDSTPDPSLGQAHLVLQVQDGAHRIIGPEPYAQARFRPPGSRPGGQGW
ncbi:MAG TPA: ABC transporter substrate-binding protein [Streptosporangiaceae bacterium]